MKPVSRTGFKSPGSPLTPSLSPVGRGEGEGTNTSRQPASGILAHTMIGFGGDIVSYLMAFLTSIVLARALGPAGRGSFAVITLVNVYLVGLVILGIGSAAEIHLAKKEYPLKVVHAFALLFSLAMGCLCLLSYLVFRSWLLQSFLGNIDQRLCFIAISLLPIALYLTIGERVLIGLGQIPVFNAVKIIRAFLYLAGPALFLLMIPLGLTGAVIGWAISIIVTAGVQCWWMLQESGWKLGWDRKIIRESISLGFKIHIAFFPVVAMMRMDFFILNYFHGAEVVGFYAVAHGLIFRVALLFSALLNAAQAKIIGHSQPASEKLVRRLIRHSVFVAVAVSFVLCLVSRPLVRWLYGDAFRFSADVLMILSVTLVAVSITNFLSIYVVGQLKKPGLSAVINWVDFFLGTILYFYFIPRFSYVGAAIACSLIWLARAGGYFWLLGWFSRPAIRETLLLRQEDFAYWKQRFYSLKMVVASRFAGEGEP